jgi:hypothetical protein
MKKLAAGGLLLAAWILACGSSGRDGYGSGPDKGAGASSSSGDNGGDFGATDASADGALPPPIGTLTGKVVMPEGTIPLSDALVYLTATLPAPLPTNAYCDKCVSLDSYAFTYSKPDGTFELPAYEAGDQYIVVQKGQFRRVRPIKVSAGTQAVASDVTRLPGKTDAALGDTTPRMLILPGQWDHVEKSLKKIGVEDFESFQPGLNLSAWSEKLKQLPTYQIVFLPCAGRVEDPGSFGPLCGVTVDPALKKAAKEFVELGGRLYVSDWSYEYVRQGWPGAITWVGETSQLGSACQGGGADLPAQFDDASLREWMIAIGEGNASLKAAWTAIENVSPIASIDENGNPFTQTPKVWASVKQGAGAKPATVSFQDRCGRVLYSTYHAEGSDSALGQSDFLAQEKALMHILLEVGVCVGPKPVPPVK